MSPGSPRETVLFKPEPHPVSRLFTEGDLAEFRRRFNVIDLVGRAGELEEHLPDAFAIVGQPELSRESIERAPNLRAVLNIEGNFYQNAAYDALFERGIHVLGCGPAYADAVAEYALGLALDLARGISREDRAFRVGAERYVAEGNADAMLLRGASVGLVGFGNLGRALVPLLAAFSPVLRGYDPWLPDRVLERSGIRPASLEEVLAVSQLVFVLATVTGESEHLLGAEQLDLMPAAARIVLVSRAPVVDYDALLARVAAGRLLAAVDVWPDEPVPADHPARQLDGLVLSAHRAGGIPQAFHEIGRMVLDDLSLMVLGLPPVRMQVAARELVGRYRNRPVT